MDQHSILDRSSASAAAQGDMPREVPGKSANRSAIASVSAGIAAANAHLPKPSDPGPRFPAEDGGRSLAEMAHNDLDAALQLLVERAQYITGASGAAIALRRGQEKDMLCRATAGSNAPELGALLSMEYGLSGESVRTRQALRCDDAERDPRVNREGCRQLGIASVVVMPIVSDEQVLGVFELFSGKPRAFEERDISALLRLSEMVETAVKHAVASETLIAAEAPAATDSEPVGEPFADAIVIETAPVESPGSETPPEVLQVQVVQAPPVKDLPPPEPQETKPEETEPQAAVVEKTKAEPELAPKKPLFWSAAMQTQANADPTAEAAASIAVPAVLRNLQKCQACGFPVSQGRAFCVECEDKQWRGQRPAKPATDADSAQAQAKAQSQPSAPTGGKPTTSASEPSVIATPQNLTAPPVAEAIAPETSPASASAVLPDTPANSPNSDTSALFLSSSMQSESWFASNKYILGALLVVAIVIGAIAWLR
jgi:GAF domain